MYPQTNQIHQERWLNVEVLEQNPQVLADYPHRYVFVITGSAREMTDPTSRGRMVTARLFWAVEALEAQGWEPVAWDLDGATVGVVMRRAGGGGTSYQLDGATQWT